MQSAKTACKETILNSDGVKKKGFNVEISWEGSFSAPLYSVWQQFVPQQNKNEAN